MMLLKIAWRNVWRNRARSLVVVIGMALGLWAGLFVSAFVNGMMRQKIDSVIEMEMSHFQVHARDFRDDYPVNRTVPEAARIRQELLDEPGVREVAARTVGYVMLATARTAGGIRLTGISTEEESTVTRLDRRIVRGSYLAGNRANPLLISEETARKFDADTGTRMVVTIQDRSGEITAAAFRVCGIYRTGNTLYDAANMFARREHVQALAGIGPEVHELAVLLREHDLTDTLVSKYRQRYPDLEVLSWMDLSSGMRYMIGVIGLYTVIIVGIVLLALLFSIVNTMLMAVLERVRELGMLMAVGMSRTRVFSMILLETLLLAAAGGPAGLLLAWTSIAYFNKAGINLGGAAYGDLGFSNLIYPVLSGPEYMKVTVMVLVMAVLASLYPARKALRLNPVEAIRKI